MSGPDHAAVERAVARVKSVYGRWRRDTPVPQMRADWDALFAARGEASIEPVQAGAVPCQWIAAPGARTDRSIVYFHGGGFRLGSPASHNELMAAISAAAGARVLAVDYRLAPEHPFPAAHADAREAYLWLLSQGAAPAQVALAGDSAGGNLALSLLVWLQSQGRAQPCAAWTLSAWTDLTASGSAYETRAALDPIHQRPMILATARNYLGEADPRDPLVSPLFAAPEQLAALPPMLLQVGERETVVSDSEDFARKARAAGAPAELQVWPGMVHVFQQFLSDLPEARAAVEQGGRFLAAQFDAASQRKTSP